MDRLLNVTTVVSVILLVTILISLPLAVPFALLTLFLAGENFQIIYTSLGILMLFGIVKKNAILQIDHIKALRFKEGQPREEAIFRGCEDRLRPILMTTASLVAGMLPMALGGGAGASSRRSIAIVSFTNLGEPHAGQPIRR